VASHGKYFRFCSAVPSRMDSEPSDGASAELDEGQRQLLLTQFAAAEDLGMLQPNVPSRRISARIAGTMRSSRSTRSWLGDRNLGDDDIANRCCKRAASVIMAYRFHRALRWLRQSRR